MKFATSLYVLNQLNMCKSHLSNTMDNMKHIKEDDYPEIKNNLEEIQVMINKFDVWIKNIDEQ